MSADVPEAPIGEASERDAPGRRRLEQFAERLIKAVFRLLKIARLHDVENQALVRPLEEFVAAVADGLQQFGNIDFQMSADLFRCNDARLRLDEETFALAQLLAQELGERGIGRLEITGSIGASVAKQLLIDLFDVPQSKDAYVEINRRFGDHQVPVRVSPEVLLGSGGGGHEALEVDRRVHALLLYGRVVILLRRLVASLGSREEVRRLARALQRCTQALVDLCQADAHSVIGLAQIKDYQEYDYHHAANVAVLSVSLGHTLGLERSELNELASCALFYDIGTFRLPREILDKPGRLTEEEWRTVRRHPMLTVSTILKMQGYSPALLRRLVVGFEHHIAYDGTGYPGALRGGRTDLFTRIIAVADAFDAMTSQRPGRTPLTPDEAMGRLLESAGTRYDPLLVKVFINVLGIFPAGTVVELSDGTFGMVVIGGEPPHLDRPKVKVLAGPDKEVWDGPLLNLAEQKPSGEFVLDVVRAVDPDRERIPVPRYLTQL